VIEGYEQSSKKALELLPGLFNHYVASIPVTQNMFNMKWASEQSCIAAGTSHVWLTLVENTVVLLVYWFCLLYMHSRLEAISWRTWVNVLIFMKRIEHGKTVL